MKPDITKIAAFLILGLLIGVLFWKDLMSPEVIHTLLGLMAGLLLHRHRNDRDDDSP